MYTYFGAFALIISGFFVVFGQEISVFLFGEAFRFSGYMLQYAAPALVFNCWASISLNILAGLGKIKQRLGVVALALGVNVVLNLIFLIFLGKGLIFSAMILSASWIVMAVGAM
jgi:O-antigen/teichoic acid export membrane protein